MASYGFKLAGAAIAFLFLGVLVIVIFERIWFRVGMGAALVVVFGGLLLVAWYVDRKDKAKRAGHRRASARLSLSRPLARLRRDCLAGARRRLRVVVPAGEASGSARR